MCQSLFLNTFIFVALALSSIHFELCTSYLILIPVSTPDFGLLSNTYHTYENIITKFNTTLYSLNFTFPVTLIGMFRFRSIFKWLIGSALFT